MHDMTQGPLRGHIVRIAAFITISMVLQTLYALVDLYWVGRLGAEAIAAVSIAANLMFIALAGTQALSVGTVALVAQAAGRKDLAAVQAGTAHATSLGIAMGVVFSLAVLLGMRAYADAVAADAHTAQLTVEYLVWFVPSLGLQFLMTAQASSLRALGKMRLALAVQMGSLLLNFTLAPVLVLGWPFGVPLGVAGAGLATFLSVLAATLVLGWALASREGPLRFPLRMLRADFREWKKILLIGLPAGGEFILMSAYLLLIYWIIQRFGAHAQAGFGIGMRWLQAFFMPALAVSFAAAAVAAQNFGARAAERVRGTFREALLQALVLMVAAMLLLQVAPAWLVGLLSKDADVIATGAEFLRIISWNLLASAVIFACSGLFQGMGNTLPSLISSAVRIAMICALALWAAGRPDFQLHQLWMLSVATTLVQAVLCALFLRREFRLRLAPASMAPAAV
ncbi:MAG: MATE family efflux transporter [Gammaproteobacteria bacterium]